MLMLLHVTASHSLVLVKSVWSSLSLLISHKPQSDHKICWLVATSKLATMACAWLCILKDRSTKRCKNAEMWKLNHNFVVVWCAINGLTSKVQYCILLYVYTSVMWDSVPFSSTPRKTVGVDFESRNSQQSVYGKYIIEVTKQMTAPVDILRWSI